MSIVVAVAVGAATWFGQSAIDDLTTTQIAMRRASGEKSITRESELVVQAVATAVAHPLGNSMIGEDTQAPLDAAIRDDRESRVQWLVVTDASGQVVAHAGSVPAADKLRELEHLLEGGVKDGVVARAPIGSGSDWVYGAPIVVGTTKVG